jgi:hypothetical protein
MFATPPILLIVGLLAQAEAMPAEVQPEAPVAPVPEVAPNPVEPSLPSPVEPVAPEPESPFKIGFRAGAEFRISADITPKVGYAFSPFLQYQVMRIAERLGLAARAEFTFSRFSKLVTVEADQTRNINEDYRDNRSLSVFDFAALAVATLRLGPVVPWLGTGIGLTVANFSTAEAAYLPGDWSRTRMVVLGAFGLDVKVKGHVQVGVHGAYRGIVNQPKFNLASGKSLTPLGDRLGVQAALLYQF